MNYKQAYVTTLLFFAFTAMTLAQTITSKVVDKKTNEPIPYATIQFSENQGVITNEEGRFSIQLNDSLGENDSIYISSMGYEKVGFLPKSITDSIIYIEPKAIELKGVFLSNKKLTIDEIMDNVEDRLAQNYHFDITQKRLFFRESEFSTMNKLNIEFKKSTIEELNKKFIDSVTALIPKKSEYYMETLCDYYGDTEKKKVNIIKAAKLYDKNNTGSMEDLSKKLEKIFKDNVKPDSYLKIKSGWFGTKVQVDSILAANEEAKATKDKIDEKKDKENHFVKYRKSAIQELFSHMFFQDNAAVNFISKSGRYIFELVDYTYIDDSSVYIINFSPKRNEDFKGTIYVNTEDFAVMRVDYENIKLLRNFKLLGLSYKENLYKGKTIFTKGTDKKYTVKYLEKTKGSIFGVDRPLKVIEKNKHVKGKRKQNELAIEIDAGIGNISKYEIVVFDAKQLSETEYNERTENKSIKPEYLSKYDPQFWQGYNIIEPNYAIRQFTAAEVE